MIEVAIVAMEEALKADGEALPHGAGWLERDPMLLKGRQIGDADDTPAPHAGKRTLEGEAAAPVSLDPPLPGA
jgi:hypothetical protein